MIDRRLFLAGLGAISAGSAVPALAADKRVDDVAELVRKFYAKGIAVRMFTIPSESMLPMLASRDLVLVGFGPEQRKPARNAVMAFRKDGLTYLKRVVGMPGDTVAFKDWGLMLNGRPSTLRDGDAASIRAEEPGKWRLLIETPPEGNERPIAIRTDILAGDTLRDIPESGIPAGHVYMVGDARSNSVDSRMPTFGPIPESDLIGTVVYRLKPVPGWLVDPPLVDAG